MFQTKDKFASVQIILLNMVMYGY